MITAADVYSVVRHIVRRQSSSFDVLNSSTWELSQQAHERRTNCSPQTNYSLVEHFRYFISCPRTFPLRRTMLNRSSDNLLGTISLWFMLYTLYARYTVIPQLSQLQVVRCKELHVAHCSLLACSFSVCLRGGHTNFDIWTSAFVTMTPNYFVFFSDYCITVATV